MSQLEGKLTTENLKQLSVKFGNGFYLLDSEQFRRNFKELRHIFQQVYPNFNIAYSYKTNYTPKLCKIVNELGGYAEVVSDMEMEIAQRCGVAASHIIWNGPVKNMDRVEELLLAGGMVNIDNLAEAGDIKGLAAKHPDTIFHIGVRCNFDVGDGVLSRFGFDAAEKEFDTVCYMIADIPNLHLNSLQCHFAKRNVEYWTARANGIIEIYDKVREKYNLVPDFIDIGGGMYGKMPESLSDQLGCKPSGYEAYAKAGAVPFAEKFGNYGPKLLVEPGSALAGDCMKFIARVENIKEVRGKSIAAVWGSQKNISMSGINPPMMVVNGGGQRENYSDIDIAGYTCIEQDFLYRHYSGEIGAGDFIVISNCGSYSVVMKPPFIMPNFPVLDISGGIENVEVIKRAETFEDLFRTFSF